MRYLIASFPRSGNHLVRGILEWAFRRPTRGAPGSRRDPAIGDRTPNAEWRAIGFESLDPVGVKLHYLHQSMMIGRECPSAGNLLLITRDPADAISSQLLRDFAYLPWLSGRRLRRSVERAVSDYLALVWLYRGWPAGRRELLEFSRLVDPEGSLDYVNRFLERQGAPLRLDAASWADLKRVTRESQRSLGRRGFRRKPRIRDAVESLLTNADVEDLIRH